MWHANHFFVRQITPQQIDDVSVMIASFAKTAWDTERKKTRAVSAALDVEMVSLTEVAGGSAAGALALNRGTDIATMQQLLARIDEMSSRMSEMVSTNSRLEQKIMELEQQRTFTC